MHVSDPPQDVNAEVQAWQRLRPQFTLAPRVWIPSAAEEGFYRLNNLPGRLTDWFADVLDTDPDEDDVEDLIDGAQAMVRQHALMDVWVDAFYESLRDLPERVRVRRLGNEGAVVRNGRPALLALREVWLAAWTLDAVIHRLRGTGSVALDAAPVVVHAEDQPLDSDDLSGGGAQSEVLFVDAERRVTRVSSRF